MKKISIQMLTLFFAAIIMTSCSDEECVPDGTIDIATSEVVEINANQYQVYTDIIVNVSAPELWSVLTDFGNMPNWSSSLQGLTGNISDGGEVEVTYILPNPVTGAPTESKFARSIMFTDGVQFGWSAESSTFIGIVDNHTFRVEAISECQSRFIQTDEFQGTNPNFTTEALANGSLPVYNQFNSELKIEAEK